MDFDVEMTLGGKKLTFICKTFKKIINTKIALLS